MPSQSNASIQSAQILYRRAQSIARVLDIPAATFTGRDRQAYIVMSHLAAMPSIIDRSRRHRYGNEILVNANSLMPDNQPQNRQFNARLRAHVALI